MQINNHKILAFGAIGLVYVAGAFLDVMDVDAAQYASISKEMMETKSYLEVMNRGKDYLDKPPLLFWLTAFFFQIFGVSNIAYRIPSILFSLLGIFSTYRLAGLYYSEKVAYLSALILASCQAVFLMNHDVRTDMMLMSTTIFSIWQLAAYLQKGHWSHFFGAFIGIGLGMMAKGPIALVVVVLAFAPDFILKRQWLNFFRWQWLLGLVVILLVLLPMSLGLYWQFDLHPEKVVNKQIGQSGLRFFYWTQSFGRITGENEWKDPDLRITFQAENFIWSFLPWTFLFIPAFYKEIKRLFQKGFQLVKTEESICFFGFLLPYIALSMSKYQLPHYTYIVYPLGAIITAKYLEKILYEPSQLFFKISFYLQNLTVVLLWFVILALTLWAFPFVGVEWLWAGWIVLLLFASVYYMIYGNESYQKLILPSLITIIGANMVLNSYVYPHLFKYQTGSVIARYVRHKTKIPVEKFVVYKTHWHSLDFYSQKNIFELTNPKEELPKLGNCWIYTNQEGLDSLQVVQNVSLKTLKTFDRYHISTLTLPFLNPQMRDKEINKVFLVEAVFIKPSTN